MEIPPEYFTGPRERESEPMVEFTTTQPADPVAAVWYGEMQFASAVAANDAEVRRTSVERQAPRTRWHDGAAFLLGLWLGAVLHGDWRLGAAAFLGSVFCMVRAR